MSTSLFTPTAKMAAAIKMEQLREIVIKAETWKSTPKKPQIVDLWYRLSKSRNRGGDYNGPEFDFGEVQKSGVRFYAYGLHQSGQLKAIRKQLDEWNIAYETEFKDQPLTIGEAS